MIYRLQALNVVNTDSNQRAAEKNLSDWCGRFKFVMGSRKVSGDIEGMGCLQLPINNFVKFSLRFGMVSLSQSLLVGIL